MFQGKTKRGIPITSTFGMKTANHKEIWILVADRSRLRMFHREKKDIGHSMELNQDFINPEGRKNGKTFLPEKRVVEMLVNQALSICDLCSLKEKNAHLYVVAEPALKGLLRPAFQKAMPKVEMSFFQKDFAWLENQELGKRLGELISS
jgi:protein required for attachment to host cells